MHIAWLPCEAPFNRNQVRSAPPGLGRQVPGFLERIRLAHVDAFDQGRDVVVEADLADQLEQRPVGADAALVPGNVEPARLAPGGFDQRVNVRGAGLVEHGRSVDEAGVRGGLDVDAGSQVDHRDWLAAGRARIAGVFARLLTGSGWPSPAAIC
jgi:hypothetical protein